MRTKSLTDLFRWFKLRSIDWVVGCVGPQRSIQSFTITGGGTGTDAVTLTSQSTGGQTCKEMASTSYQVLVTPAASKTVYVTDKTTTSFNVKGLGSSEKADVMVLGRLKGMPKELEV
jgi:hypothetical protein